MNKIFQKKQKKAIDNYEKVTDDLEIGDKALK